MEPNQINRPSGGGFKFIYLDIESGQHNDKEYVYFVISILSKLHTLLNSI